jgi:hypothetical protein
MDKKKEIVELNPQSAEYAAKIQQARGVAHPVGGAPMPKMPNFAQTAAGDRHSGVQNQQRQQGMAALLSPEQRAVLESQGKAIPGVGSAYAANQPAAQKIADPAAPTYQNPIRGEKAGLTQETAEQLEAVAKANAPDAEQPKQQEDEEEDLFDYDELGNKIKNLLANKSRREAIEARCEPMDLMELLVNKEARQVVPIIPHKYYPTFRTMGGDEDLEIKRILSPERGSTQYILGRAAIMNLTCGLYAMNGKPLPPVTNPDGVFDLKLFEEKYRSISKYPLQVLADLSVNYSWFDRRVRALLALETIKDF